MILPRAISTHIKDKLTSTKKGIILYGARQVGKTTLVQQIITELKLKTLYINADQGRFLDILSSRDLSKIVSLTTGYELLFIDEAQRIADIGVNLKIILDNLPIKVIVTGSSSLDLASRISEPLTGRVWTYRLYPVSFFELQNTYNTAELDAQIENRLIYGSYPEIFSYPSGAERIEYLQNLTNSYLYKDLLDFGGFKNSSKIRDLLKLLAFQVGSQVSLSELGKKLEMGKDTVNRYIDFLEKSFVLFRLKGLSRNLRKEVSKMDKIYFYDVGVRNTLIDNHKALRDRNDVGQLWENFLVVERIKLLAYTKHFASIYFWRTHTGAELDYVEESGGKISGYEFKFSLDSVRAPKSWLETYQNGSFLSINRQNYLNFILKP